MLRSVVEFAEAVRSRRVSPVELAEDALARIEAWQPVINAFSQVRPEESLDDARATADRLARGEEPGPLAGVPFAVKDLFDVVGWETTGCCAAYRGRVAGKDAPVVARLRAAGAVVVAKTNQHELAAGATNLVSACGPTRNPWDPSRLTGGSSGGSGAAVAAGCVPLALGSDTGGSVRIPASFCGVTGVKTTHGLVPLEGVMPLAPSLDTVGPLATDAVGARLAHSVLVEADIHGSPAMPARIGVVTDDLVRAVTPEVTEAVEVVTAWLGDRAAPLPSVVLEAYRPEDWETLAWRELYEAHGRLLEAPELLGEPTRALLERGRAAGADELQAARARARQVRGSILEALREVEALLLPATPFPAPEAETLEIEVPGQTLSVRKGAISVLTRPVNLAGLPAVAFPAGFSGEGLPVGVQVVGSPGSEALLLAVVAAWQKGSAFHLRGPELPAG